MIFLYVTPREERSAADEETQTSSYQSGGALIRHGATGWTQTVLMPLPPISLDKYISTCPAGMFGWTQQKI